MKRYGWLIVIAALAVGAGADYVRRAEFEALKLRLAALEAKVKDLADPKLRTDPKDAAGILETGWAYTADRVAPLLKEPGGSLAVRVPPGAVLKISRRTRTDAWTWFLTYAAVLPEGAKPEDGIVDLGQGDRVWMAPAGSKLSHGWLNAEALYGASIRRIAPTE